VWFIVLTTFLVFLSKSHMPSTVAIISVATIAVIRISAYYNESLSQDLAKIVPFTILGVFLVDTNLISFDAAWGILTQLPALWKSLLYYLIFVILVEYMLVVVGLVLDKVWPERGKDKEDK